MVLTVTGGFTMNVVTGEFKRANVTCIVTEETPLLHRAHPSVSCPAQFPTEKKKYREKNGRGAQKSPKKIVFSARFSAGMLSWERIAGIAAASGRFGSLESGYWSPDTTAVYDVDFTEEWLLVRSACPCETEPGITHYVLFRRRDLPMVSPRAFLRGVLGRAVDDGNVAWFENPHGSGADRHYHVFVRAPTGVTQLSDDLEPGVDVHAQVADAYSSWLLHVESIERDSQSSRTGV